MEPVKRREAEEQTCNRVLALAEEWGAECVSIRLPRHLQSTVLGRGWADEGPVKVFWNELPGTIAVEVHSDGQLVLRVEDTFDLT